ncbi:MAG: hypothetical protein IAE77_06215 [Prosthecobacter sp.]|jgi:hypothetical protein|uniref:hypothetical protein n=1 Tax=Prosthecobacter sp. TaxID=1965333 RepID=UPI0019E87686|nr:hypothetical protein [Prosthecobacter sp.]MBE2283036.1 hypothetical protein [Prosthecobacter sp.]
MNCPNCGQKTVSFREWSKALNAFNWCCRACRCNLEANWLVKWTAWTALIVGLILGLRPLFKGIAEDRKVEALEMATGIAQGLAAVVVLGCIAWFFGGYKVILSDEHELEEKQDR